jgi:putative FmdB family regulatory protein
MPIYEYRCDECGAQKEILQRISDAPLIDCTECGKPALRKLVSAAGFQLKGTGWYVTDFRDKKPAAKADKAGKTESKSESKSDKSADAAKPADSTTKEASKTESSPASTKAAAEKS